MTRNLDDVRTLEPVELPQQEPQPESELEPLIGCGSWSMFILTERLRAQRVSP